MQIYAHRGASGAFPENTIEAFQWAIDLGVDGIETDVRCTSDDVPILSHDQTLLRAFGLDRDVQNLTRAELRSCAPWVPTLEELLTLAGSRVHLNVEIKQTGIERAVLGVLDACHSSRWAISCFDWTVLEACRTMSSSASLWLLTESSTPDLWTTSERLAASGIAVSASAIQPKIAPKAHERGLTVMAWTVNDLAESKTLRSRGVDAICTDFPEQWTRDRPAGAISHPQTMTQAD
jgi:glycerophosphoryl diester phosphodiesterase